MTEFDPGCRWCEERMDAYLLSRPLPNKCTSDVHWGHSVRKRLHEQGLAEVLRAAVWAGLASKAMGWVG